MSSSSSSSSTVEIELATRTPLPSSTANIAEITSPTETLGTDLEPPSKGSSIRRLSLDFNFQPDPSERNVSSLAPVDGGFGAWTFLAASFVIELLVWGLPNSFGVFLNSYLQDPRFTSQRNASSILPLIGTLSSGIMYCSGPILYPFVSRYPRARRIFLWVGVVFCWTSLFVASYTTNVVHLLIFQGILYAIGGALLYAPVMSLLPEWFVRRRGLASGIMNAGTAVGGLVLPPILPSLVAKHGRAYTLRILSFVFVSAIVVAIPFLKPRLPESQVHGPAPRGQRSYSGDHEGEANSLNESSNRTLSLASSQKWAWLTNIPFHLAILATALQALAYFVPVLYLPSFASSLGLSDSDASLSVALLNGASLISRITFGLLSDRLNSLVLGLMAAFGTSVVTFVLWGVVAQQVTSHLSGLLVFGIAYGALAGGWTSLFVGFIRPVASDDPRLVTSVLGLFLLVQGVGNILSTPISTALFESSSGAGTMLSVSPSVANPQGSGGYEKMIVYVGTCFAGTGLIAVLGFLIERSHFHRTHQAR